MRHTSTWKFHKARRSFPGYFSSVSGFRNTANSALFNSHFFSGEGPLLRVASTWLVHCGHWRGRQAKFTTLQVQADSLLPRQIFNSRIALSSPRIRRSFLIRVTDHKICRIMCECPGMSIISATTSRRRRRHRQIPISTRRGCPNRGTTSSSAVPASFSPSWPRRWPGPASPSCIATAMTTTESWMPS